MRSNINLEGHSRGQLDGHLNKLKKYNEEIGIKKLQNECNEIYKETDTLKKYRRLGKLKFIEIIDLSNSLDWINSFLNLVESKLSPSGVSLIEDQNDLEDKMIKVFEDHKNQIGKIT